MSLPVSFLTRPIAHRALHDRDAGHPENSAGAVRAAVAAGYGIEIDLQLSADGQAIVFHDYTLDRLTGEVGPVIGRCADALGKIMLTGCDEGIPTLANVLAIVDGQVPLLIELKDQDGALGEKVGLLEDATAALLRDYQGDVAVMSFNPHSVARMAMLLPRVPRGLVTEDFRVAEGWSLPEATRARLTGIPDFDRVGAHFISHNRHHLALPRVADLKAAGAPVLCWTVRSPEEEAEARRVADNVTFEGYLA